MVMVVTKRRLDIDRWMDWVECECGSKFWACERRDFNQCPGCKYPFRVQPLAQEFLKKEREAGNGMVS